MQKFQQNVKKTEHACIITIINIALNITLLY